MASAPSEAQTPPPAPISDDEDTAADLPLTMAASVVLTSLPRDAAKALEGAGELQQSKGIQFGALTVRFQPVGSAPHLQQRVFKVSSAQRFETVVRFLRRKLGVRDSDSVFCYVNSVFAPGLDEGIGNLWRCFKTNEELVVAYSITPAFG
ncbi:APG12-domain-containing protein [Glonium stellatum]|uniref:Ubiquitin-like protein ATG12 n=1 Tax=Glonium stellatum TaxID=574774 RepID=A0A8E2F1S3_9PEZI|nr:APG12-domain-containing protein [Glonium stellatum]